MHNISQAVQSLPLETYGGLIAFIRPENLPEGASPRNQDMDFLVGSAQTRAPLQSVYSYAAASSGPNRGQSAASSTWSDPSAVLSNGASYASVTAASANLLTVTEFGFALPQTVTPTGVTVLISGFSNSAVTLSVQLLKAGVAVGTAQTVALPNVQGTVALGGANDLWGASFASSDINNEQFGVQITAMSSFSGAQAQLNSLTVQVGQTTANANFNFITTFVNQNGSVQNLSLDADGNFWMEDVTNNPGVLTLLFGGITPGSFASAASGPGVEYLAFNNLTCGSDVPRQYTGKWTDRISQVGPGASPVFAASSASTTNYAITSITQPAARSWGYAYFLQSTGPGSTSPGSVVTVYYADSTQTGEDATLVNAFNSSNAVYLYTSFTGVAQPQGPTTAQVTSVGLASPPGQPRPFYYYTYVVPTSQYLFYAGSGNAGYTANYQITLATMTTGPAVPQLSVGSSAVVTGSSVAAWDATWPIAQTLNSGSMVITQTSLTGGVATYSYAVNSGANPTAGQLVTITGTLNANGTLNGVNLTIATVSGTNIGTFTIDGFSAVTNYPAQQEQGQGVTAGTEFCFDPGLLTMGTSTSPIYGNATGGEIVVTGVGQYISPGTKQGVVFFITRNGYYTAPSPPVTFDVPDNSTSITASNIPLGPPNVVARGIAFTESGSNGVPGGNFFTLPTAIQYIVQGTTYTCTSLFINDNVSTSASFFFPDSELLQAEAIDIYGNNLFNLIEIGNPGWIVRYADRNAYGLCQNKIQNFNNLSFDGGYLPGGQLTPLGWSVPDAYGSLLVSPVFGNSYYIRNSTAETLAQAGLIQQSAYQDAYLQPILDPNTLYSVRVTACAPSGNLVGSLVVALVSHGVTYGTFTIPFARLTTQMQTLTGTVLTSVFSTVPTGLTLEVYGSSMAAGADVEIDRIEVFQTDVPVDATSVYFSYAGDPESVDAVTGVVGFTSENQQPVNGAVVMYDTFYALKQGSMYALQSSGNQEPGNWNEPEVAQRAGACGINAYDFGAQWLVEACRNGLYLFEGGQPGRIMEEIFPVWNAINWNAGSSIWVKVDVPNRRLYVGVPLPTPNFWLPDAPSNPDPTSPNVMLMCNYQGCDTGAEIQSMIGVHTTMFGTLMDTDMRRKWSIWQIQSPYANVVSSSGQAGAAATGEINILDGEVRFCNGVGNSKIYRLNTKPKPGETPTDDGAPINSLYTTYGWVSPDKAAQMPLLGLFRKLWSYITHQVSGVGTLNLRLLPNTLLGPTDSSAGYYPWTLPGGFPLADPCTQIHEAPLNFAATRTFLEFSTTGRMEISNVVLVGKRHPHNVVTGLR